jgi:hypothetical protein
MNAPGESVNLAIALPHPLRHGELREFTAQYIHKMRAMLHTNLTIRERTDAYIHARYQHPA